MTPDEFFGHVAEKIVDIESATFSRDFRVHHDEQEKITQFFAKICVVIGTHCLGYFVSLFNQSRQQRFVRLLAIPRTTPRRPQLCNDLAKFLEVIREW